MKLEITTKCFIIKIIKFRSNMNIKGFNCESTDYQEKKHIIMSF